MTDSLPLETVFVEVLAEHAERSDFANQTACCVCGWNGGLVTLWRVHVAEQLAARLLARRDLLLEALGGKVIPIGPFTGGFVFPIDSSEGEN